MSQPEAHRRLSQWQISPQSVLLFLWFPFSCFSFLGCFNSYCTTTACYVSKEPLLISHILLVSCPFVPLSFFVFILFPFSFHIHLFTCFSVGPLVPISSWKFVQVPIHLLTCGTGHRYIIFIQIIVGSQGVKWSSLHGSCHFSGFSVLLSTLLTISSVKMFAESLFTLVCYPDG